MKREKFRFAGQTVKIRKDIQKFGGADLQSKTIGKM